MDFIKYLDLFTIRFSFYTNNQPTNQSLFGGIMSFIYFLVSLLVFIFLSYDDIKRLNPITTMSEIPDTERKLVSSNKEKIWIPFRIVNFENKFIDHRGILYLVPYLIEGKFNENIGMDLKYTLLNYTLCNETSMVNMPSYHKLSIPLSELFCIDKDDLILGGNWNHNFLNYIELNLYLCEDGVVYNSSEPRCSKIDNYLNSINSSLLIDFYFPIIQFQPTNLKIPLEIIYRNYFYRLTSYNYRVQKLFIRENILSDDKNIFKNNAKNTSFWGMSQLVSDDYFLSKIYDPIADNSNSSRIYSLNIYIDDGIIYYTRTFRKIVEIISNAFPIIKFILYFIKKITRHVKMSLAKRKLIELIFEEKKIIQPKKLFKKNFENINNNLQSQSQNSKLIIETNKSENEIIKDKIIGNNNLININNKNIKIIRNNYINKNDNETIKNNNNILNYKITSSSNNENNIKINKKEISSNKSENEQSEIKEYYSNNKKDKNGEVKYIFPYYYYFLDIIFNKSTKPLKFFCIRKTYFIIYNFMCQIYDVSTYIMIFKQFNLINNMLKGKIYQDNGIFPNKIYKKININDKNITEKLSKDINNDKSILYSNYFL